MVTAETAPATTPSHTVIAATRRPATTSSAGQGVPSWSMPLRMIARLIRQPRLVITGNQAGGGRSSPCWSLPRSTPMARQNAAQIRHTSPDRRPIAIEPCGGRSTDVTAWLTSSRMTSQ